MTQKKSLALALGSALAASLAVTPALQAADNPFQMETLKSGFQVADNKSGEAKCGGDKAGESKCGGDKAGESKCGGDKAGESKCGGDKAKENKCGGDKAGESKCGGDK